MPPECLHADLLTSWVGAEEEAAEVCPVHDDLASHTRVAMWVGARHASTCMLHLRVGAGPFLFLRTWLSVLVVRANMLTFRVGARAGLLIEDLASGPRGAIWGTMLTF